MSIFVQIGTTGFLNNPTNSAVAPAGYVIYSGALVYDDDGFDLLMVWDDTIDNGDGTFGNIRAYTNDELKTIEAKNKRIEVKNWASKINGRAYEHAGNSDDFDNFISHMRLAIRETINDFAAQEGLTARISKAEIKADFSNANPRFDLIVKSNEAKNLMRTEINALRDDPLKTVDDIKAYDVSDTNAGALHAAANPTDTPSLDALLASYPVQTV